MLSVGCQLGEDYRCTILFLVARRCVPRVGVLRGTINVDASMSHRWGVSQVRYPWVSVGEKNVW